jgi:predicted Zn finger-like uncharacterized protein
MPASAAINVVIECPHCKTRYQVGQAAIGTKGREVQCAHCGKSWHAKALPPPKPQPQAVTKAAPAKPVASKPADALGDDIEQALDAEFVTEERRHLGKDGAPEAHVGPSSPEAQGSSAGARSEGHQRALDEVKAALGQKPAPEKLDPAAGKLRLVEFARRQAHLSSTLPMAKMRRTARIAAAVLLGAVIGGALLFRTQVVQQFPELAGVYAAVGLGVNVIGLEFSNVHTLESLKGGAVMLVVDGDIRSVSGQQVAVPQVIVTLLGPNGAAAYEWSVAPAATELRPGETVHFETQFTAPPAGAERVKLTFANGRSQSGLAEPVAASAPMASPESAGAPPSQDPGKS